MVWDTLSRQVEAVRGGKLRSSVRALLRRTGLYPWLRRRRRPQRCQSFTTAFVALAAKMAAADGVAVKAEAEAFERFLDVDDAELARVRRLYDLAKEDPAGYETYADRIGRMLADEPQMKREVLECLLFIACSDGILHPAEDGYLQEVARRFGFEALEWQTLRAGFVHDPGSPYAVLGLAPSASVADIKRAYRKLAAETHPDRLAAEGAPLAVVKAASARMAHLNAAYETILRERQNGRWQP